MPSLGLRSIAFETGAKSSVVDITYESEQKYSFTAIMYLCIQSKSIIKAVC